MPPTKSWSRRGITAAKIPSVSARSTASLDAVLLWSAGRLERWLSRRSDCACCCCLACAGAPWADEGAEETPADEAVAVCRVREAEDDEDDSPVSPPVSMLIGGLGAEREAA